MAPPPDLASRAQAAADGVVTARADEISKRQTAAQRKDARAQAVKERELLPARMETCVCDRELLATYLGIAPKSMGIIGVMDALPVIVNELAVGDDDIVGTKSDRYKLETVSGTVFKYEGVLYARYRTPSQPECFGVVQSFRDPDSGRVALRISGRFHDVVSLNGSLGSATLPHIERTASPDDPDIAFDVASGPSTVKVLSKMSPRFVRIDHRTAEKFVSDRHAREEAERLDAEARLWDDRWNHFRESRRSAELVRTEFALRMEVGIPGVEVLGVLKAKFLNSHRRVSNNFILNDFDHCVVLRYNDRLYVDATARRRPRSGMPLPNIVRFATLDFYRSGPASIDFKVSGTFDSPDGMERTLHRREDPRVINPAIDDCVQYLREQTRDFLPLDAATAASPTREVLTLALDKFCL